MLQRQPWLTSAGLAICLVAGGLFVDHRAAAAPEREEFKKPPGMIDRATQEVIDASYAYLARNQDADGSFGTGTQKGGIATTGLAGLAFLAGGHKPGEGKYGKHITSALNYLIGQEDPQKPGFLNFAQGQLFGPMYGHGFATLFLAEAKGLVKDAELQKKIDGTLGRAVTLIIQSQNHEGGWRYLPVPRDADISVTSVQIMALHAAGRAGVEVPKVVKVKYVRYVKECSSEEGGFRYQRHVGIVGFARSAAGVAALLSAGERDCDEVVKGLDYLKYFQPGAKEERLNTDARLHYFFGHFFAAQAMRQAGGQRWQDWYAAVREHLLNKSGYKQVDGSFQDRHFCPHYCTAMAILILQTPGNDLASAKRK